MSATIRLAKESDAADILDIYAPIVRDTAISFEFDPPSIDDMQSRIKSTLEFAPWLVCDWNGKVVGYAYASKFRARPAYQWTVETTVYVAESSHRKGVAGALYKTLLECLHQMGFRSAIAVITLPNVASVRLHERLGFKRTGTTQVGGNLKLQIMIQRQMILNAWKHLSTRKYGTLC